MNFEYLIIDTRLNEERVNGVEARINALGADGWRLVSTCGLHNQTFVFMRETADAGKSARKRG